MIFHTINTIPYQYHHATSADIATPQTTSLSEQTIPPPSYNIPTPSPRQSTSPPFRNNNSFRTLDTIRKYLPTHHWYPEPWHSIIIAKPCLIADTLLIGALPSFQSLWLFPMPILSFPPNCRLRSWASQDLVRPFTPRLLVNAPKASFMMCATHGMWFLNAGRSIPEASWVHCNPQLVEEFEEALSVVIPCQQLLVRSKRSTRSFTCTASLVPVCLWLTKHSS